MGVSTLASFSACVMVQAAWEGGCYCHYEKAMGYTVGKIFSAIAMKVMDLHA